MSSCIVGTDRLRRTVFSLSRVNLIFIISSSSCWTLQCMTRPKIERDREKLLVTTTHTTYVTTFIAPCCGNIWIFMWSVKLKSHALKSRITPFRLYIRLHDVGYGNSTQIMCKNDGKLTSHEDLYVEGWPQRDSALPCPSRTPGHSVPPPASVTVAGECQYATGYMPPRELAC